MYYDMLFSVYVQYEKKYINILPINNAHGFY